MTRSAMAFSTLKFAYDNRYAALPAAQRAAQPVIGYVGAAFPRELALAAGALPIAMTPRGAASTPIADRYIEPIVARDIRDLFEAGVMGEWAQFDLLVITRPYAKLFYYLKEMYRQGRAPKLPALHMFDLMQSQRDAVVTYNEGQWRELIEVIARVSKRQIDDDALAQALAETRQTQEMQRQLLTLRWQRALTGVEALVALGAANFMSPAAYRTALGQFLAVLEPKPGDARPRWLIATAEPLTHVDLHAALEAAGGLVVAEDDAWGSRALAADPPADTQPLAALQSMYLTAATGHEWPENLRERWFETHVTRSEVDGVVFYIPPSDRQFGWDYPRLKRLADQAGKPTLLIRDEARTDLGRENIRAAASTFHAACIQRALS